MIGSIRNKWLRRAAIVVAFPIFAVLAAILGAIAGVAELCRDAMFAWND